MMMRLQERVPNTATPTSTHLTSQSLEPSALSMTVVYIDVFQYHREFALGLAAMEWSSTNSEV
jgi:hypothetical protein